MEPDYYALLGVAPDATHEEIKKAFRQAALREHPDRMGGLGTDVRIAAGERLRQINAAGAVLCNPERRAQYDARTAEARRARRANGRPAEGYRRPARAPRGAG